VTYYIAATMPEAFLNELSWRGLLHQTTSETLGAYLAVPGRIGYAGFDPTSDSLTVGNLIPLLLLARWQRAGHVPIALMGGGTGLIGDPSGKTAERSLIDRDQVRANMAAQRPVFERLLDFSGSCAARIVDNADWLVGLGYIEVLRDIGKHFSVNQMIARDSVATRLHGREQGISYTEFSYMILQAYDFLHLHRAHACTVQLGGADQWGNIVSGIDLVRRITGGECFGITNPLLTKADGTKIGKTESGAIYVGAHRTSPYRFHQYWLNASDDDALRFLKWFTFLGREEIEAIGARHAAEPQSRGAQRRLADELTTLIHGADETARANACAHALFGGDVRALDAASVAAVAEDLPTAELARDALAGPGVPMAEALVAARLASSKREARDFLAAGSVSVNGEKVAADSTLTAAHLMHGTVALLRRGKRQWAAVRAV
jgi:tyrosyl-tRNA synthetase